MLYLDFEAQGRSSTFTFRHALLKKAILEGKTCNGRFILQGTVLILIRKKGNHGGSGGSLTKKEKNWLKLITRAAAGYARQLKRG